MKKKTDLEKAQIMLEIDEWLGLNNGVIKIKNPETNEEELWYKPLDTNKDNEKLH